MPDGITGLGGEPVRTLITDLPPGTRLLFQQATPPDGWKFIAVQILCEKE